MAHVIGLPLHRGNSEIYTPVKLSGDATGYFEGQAVSWAADGVVGQPVAGKVVGFVIDINVKSGYATLIQAVNDTMLPVEGAIVAGTRMAIDAVTKKVCAAGAGKIATNGFFSGPAAMAIDGKTGALVNCAKVRFGFFEDQGVDVAGTLSATAAKAAK